MESQVLTGIWMTKTWPLLQPNTFLIGLPWRQPLWWCLEECSCLASLYEGLLTTFGANHPLEKRGETLASSWFHNLGQLSGAGLLLFRFPQTHYQKESINAWLTGSWLNTRFPVNFQRPPLQEQEVKDSQTSQHEGTHEQQKMLGKSMFDLAVCAVVSCHFSFVCSSNLKHQSCFCSRCGSGVQARHSRDGSTLFHMVSTGQLDGLEHARWPHAHVWTLGAGC